LTYQFIPFVVHAKPQQKMESNINTPQRIVSKFSFMPESIGSTTIIQAVWTVAAATTLRRSSGGVVWFSCHL